MPAVGPLLRRAVVDPILRQQRSCAVRGCRMTLGPKDSDCRRHEKQWRDMGEPDRHCCVPGDDAATHQTSGIPSRHRRCPPVPMSSSAFAGLRFPPDVILWG